MAVPIPSEYPLAMSAPRTIAPPDIHRGSPRPTYGEWAPARLPLLPGCGKVYAPMWNESDTFSAWAPNRGARGTYDL